MREPDFLTLEDIFAEHKKAIALYGGSDGVMSRGGLESACSSARNYYAYYGDELSDRAGFALLAACYWTKINLAHGFVKGNKRTAVRCCLLFLSINGYEIGITDDEQLSMGPLIATHEIDEEAVTRFLVDRLTGQKI